MVAVPPDEISLLHTSALQPPFSSEALCAVSTAVLLTETWASEAKGSKAQTARPLLPSPSPFWSASRL